MQATYFLTKGLLGIALVAEAEVPSLVAYRDFSC